MFDSLLRLVEFIGAFLIVLVPLIIVHELGHFLAAKWLRIGVPVFSVGLGPRLFGFRRRETDYRVSAIPLGGYVRLQGDEADEHRTGAPEEFLSRPRWQRFIVFVAGPAVNVILAIFVFWGVLYAFGVDELPVNDNPPVVVRLAPGSAAEASGVRVGDRVISIEGRDARAPEVFVTEVDLYPESVRRLVVERDGWEVELDLQTGYDRRRGLGDPGWLVLQENYDPPLLVQVLDGPAKEAGLRPGDLVLAADDRDPITEPELRLLLARSAGREVRLKVEREGVMMTVSLTPEDREGQGMIGVLLGPSNIVHRDFTVGGAFVESLRICGRLSGTLFLTLNRVIRGILPVQVFSGPVEIAKVSKQMVEGGLRPALWFMAFISLQLGIVNMLPIPVLDGGHILILAVEGLRQRELSLRVKERVMQFGVGFLFLFFLAVIVADILKAGA